MRIGNFSHWLIVAVAVAVIALLWAPVGPAQLGGPVSIVITHGSSMEPGIHQGDLVIVRKTSQVVSGDIVLYRSGSTGQQTLHRVVAVAGDGVITRGDNNSWIDPDRPAIDEIRGAHWFQIPGAGAWLGRLQHPFSAAIIGGIAMGLLAMSISSPAAGSQSPRRTRQSSGSPAVRTVRTWLAVFAQGTGADAVMAASALIFAGGLLLGAWAFTSPAHEDRVEGIPYNHVVNWSYTAATVGAPAIVTRSGDYIIIAAPSLIDSDVHTGQPIFAAVNPNVVMEVSYHFNAPDAEAVHGSARVFAILRDEVTGWHREFPASGLVAFAGGSTSFVIPADVNALMAEFALLQQTSRSTGLYRIIIAIEVVVEGEIRGERFTDRHLSTITFRVEPPHMIRVDRAATGEELLGLAQQVDPTAEIFNQVAPRQVPITFQVNRIVPVLLWEISVPAFRFMAVTLALVAVAIAATLYALRRWSAGFGEWFAVRTRYGGLLVATDGPPVAADDPALVDLDALHDLIVIAESRGQHIRDVEGPDAVDFWALDRPNAIFHVRLSLPAATAPATAGWPVSRNQDSHGPPTPAT